MVDPEVADLRDDSAHPGGCGVSVNRYRTAASAEFRRRLLSCDVFQDSFNDVWSCHISDDAQPTAAVRTDRQIDCEYSAQPLHPRHRRSRCSRVGLTSSTQRLHRSVCTRAASSVLLRRVRHHRAAMLGVGGEDAVASHQGQGGTLQPLLARQLLGAVARRGSRHRVSSSTPRRRTSRSCAGCVMSPTRASMATSRSGRSIDCRSNVEHLEPYEGTS